MTRQHLAFPTGCVSDRIARVAGRRRITKRPDEGVLAFTAKLEER